MSNNGKSALSNDYEDRIRDWLSKHYQSIAETLYDQHVIGGGTRYKYKSRLVMNAVKKCADLHGIDRKEALARIRRIFHNKSKAKSKFTILELEDFCNIEQATPGEILKSGYNMVHTHTLLDKKDVEIIKENFNKLSKEEKNQIVCLCFPVLGVLGVACFETGKCSSQGCLVGEREYTTKVSYNVISCLGEEDRTGFYTARNYDELRGIFDCAVRETADKLDFKKYGFLKSLSPLINGFFETEYKLDDMRVGKSFDPRNGKVPDKEYA